MDKRMQAIYKATPKSCLQNPAPTALVRAARDAGLHFGPNAATVGDVLRAYEPDWQFTDQFEERLWAQLEQCGVRRSAGNV